MIIKNTAASVANPNYTVNRTQATARPAAGAAVRTIIRQPVILAVRDNTRGTAQ